MHDWANLPDHIIALIFSYLSVAERCRVGATCKHWLQCLETPLLWRTFSCGFFLPQHGRLVKCVEQYCHFITRLTITLNHREPENRKNALAVIECLTGLNEVRLTHLTIQFQIEKWFYYEYQFMSALNKFFTKLGDKKEISPLKYLNFSNLQVDFDDEFMNGIASHCPNLEYVNILNEYLPCKVSPECIASLVEKCKKLKTLHLYHTSLNDEVITKFAEPNRVPLQRLKIVCPGNGNIKYKEDISSEAWSKLIRANPDLKVWLVFVWSPLNSMSKKIIKPEIPVQVLYLDNPEAVYDEINIAASYYEDTLESLFVVNSWPCKELDEAVLNVAQRCKKLYNLCVYCVLDKSVIDKVLELHPVMKERGTFNLKWE